MSRSSVNERLERIDILGCYIHKVTMEQALECIDEFIEQRQSAQIVTLNAEIVYQGTKNERLREVINQAALVTPDGIGVIWASKIIGQSFSERVTGIDLLLTVCALAKLKQWRLYLLGAAPGVAEIAKQRLIERNPGLIICGLNDGYFSEKEIPGIIADIRASRPDIIAVGLGAPKQEFWIQEHKDELEVPVLIGVGGSLDVIAGIKKRAPQWAIKLNLEWMYRLLKEPSRFKRQLALPLFMLAVLKARILGKKDL